MKRKSLVLIVFLLVQVSFILGCSSNNPTSQNEQGKETKSVSFENKLIVRYLNLISEEKAGDAIFIQTPDSVTMLIDAGRTPVGSQVDQFLQNLNVQTIDVAVGTHPHIDHIGGFLTVLDSKWIGRILLPHLNHPSTTYEKLNQLISEQEIDRQFIEAGDVFPLGEEVTVQVLNPPVGTQPPNPTSITAINDLSLVLKVTYGETSFLFTGDINMNREQKLTDEYGDVLQADVLDAPHHGLATSSSLNFIHTVDPELVVISQSNAEGVEDSYVYSRYDNYGSKILITGKQGNITLISDGKKVEEASGHKNPGSYK